MVITPSLPWVRYLLIFSNSICLFIFPALLYTPRVHTRYTANKSGEEENSFLHQHKKPLYLEEECADVKL